MDMTGWLDYFITGLETQMIEVKERGEQVIKRDVLVQKHGLNERQANALDLLMKNSSAHISEIEELCPGVTRRTLQRDMNGLIEIDLVRITGSARQSNYEFIK
jgi:predicted transcriptional regulator